MKELIPICELKEIEARIKSLKLMLIKKAINRNGVYENFGQKEVRKLQDIFGYTKDIEEFDNWCMGFDDNDLNKTRGRV